MQHVEVRTYINKTLSFKRIKRMKDPLTSLFKKTDRYHVVFYEHSKILVPIIKKKVFVWKTYFPAVILCICPCHMANFRIFYTMMKENFIHFIF